MDASVWKTNHESFLSILYCFSIFVIKKLIQNIVDDFYLNALSFSSRFQHILLKKEMPDGEQKLNWAKTRWRYVN